MDRDLMQGMFWAGLLLSAIPLALGIAAGVYALRRLRASRRDAPERNGADRRTESPAEA